MVLLYRCDHHDCHTLDLAHWQITAVGDVPIIPPGWVTGPHGDFCSEECEQRLILWEEDERERERKRANTTTERRSLT